MHMWFHVQLDQKILDGIYYLPLCGHFIVYTLNVDKNGHFWTTYPPHLVHVVIERPAKLLQHSTTYTQFILNDKTNAHSRIHKRTPQILEWVILSEVLKYSNSIIAMLGLL